MSKETGLQLAEQIKGYVSRELANRQGEIEPPEVKLTTYATVDTTAIGEALRHLAPLLEASVASANDIRDGIAEAVKGWARDDMGIAEAISSHELDLTPLATAISSIKVPDHSKALIQLSKDIAELTAASDRQTAAIKDQTARMEAAAKLTKTVSYDAAGRVKTIKAG